jgi:hypothetical protein
MQITGTIEFSDPVSRESASRILLALSPDNLRSMESETIDGRVAVRFSSQKIGSLLATVDDFLMNVKIGEEVEKTLKNEK